MSLMSDLVSEPDFVSLVQVVLFLVLLPLIYVALGESTLDENPGRSVIAIAVALLCVMSLGKVSVDAVLIPYGALALSLPFVALLALLSRCRRKLRHSRDARTPGRHRKNRRARSREAAAREFCARSQPTGSEDFRRRSQHLRRHSAGGPGDE